MDCPVIDPLQYLSSLERFVCGWLVTRMFATNTPRFAHNIESYGVKSTAISSCVKALNLYAAILVWVAIVDELAHAPRIADVAFALVGLCVLWSVPRIITAWRLQREFLLRGHDAT